MQGNLLEDLKAWQQQGNRSVEIKIEGCLGEVRIWVYDYDLREGQFVSSVDEIDLETKKNQRERQEYEKLRKQFEGEATV
ncbi:hypothetical protein [Anaerosolibacter sp.]|uniref:hypothetical protein n=1 Tax=Anaerosolibacter sp. TaxID=1872527 RepID=UPI0039EE9B6F